MNWFSQNKFLAGFLLVLVLAIGAAGFFLSTTHGKFREAMNTFDQEKLSLASLEGKPLYPSQENVDTIMAQSKAYEEKVLVLQQGLLKFQKPLDTSIANTEFPNIVKAMTTKFQSVAESKGVKLPEEFYMGFPTYRDVFPRPPAVALLHYQAQAIEALFHKLVFDGVEEIVSINREALAVEDANYKEPDPAPVLERYPLELVIRGNHESIRRFLNTISNDEENFLNIRVMRIENSVKEGPLRGMADPESTATEPFQDIGFPVAETPDEAAPEAAKHDARIIMGQEKIQIYLLIDVLRFVEIK